MRECGSGLTVINDQIYDTMHIIYSLLYSGSGQVTLDTQSVVSLINGRPQQFGGERYIGYSI